MAGRVIFGIVCVLTSLAVYLSYLILRHRQRPPALSYLGVSYIFFALWLIASFIHLVPEEPSTGFITLQFRICYALISPALGFLVLFGLTYLKGKDLSLAPKLALSSACAIFVLLASSSYVIEKAEFLGDHYYVEYGPLYIFNIAFFAALASVFFWALVKKARVSSGTERMRALYIIAGYAFFTVAAVTLSFLIPFLAGRDAVSDYAYPLMIFPLSTTSYALLKQRLLDIRLAARRAISYMLVLLFFGVPTIAVFGALGYRFRMYPSVLAAMTLAIVVFSALLIPALMRLAEQFTSRHVFGDLYRKEEVVDTAVSLALDGRDPESIVLPALAFLKQKMGLSDIATAIRDDPLDQEKEKILTLFSASMGRRSLDVADIENDLGKLIEAARVVDVDQDKGTGGENAFKSILSALGFRASLPLKGIRSVIGVLLAGPKESGEALDPYDLDTLEEFSLRLGIILENHHQATRLAARLKEMEKVKAVLQTSETLKDHVIALAHNELKEPVECLVEHVRKYLVSSSGQLPHDIQELLGDAASRLEKVMGKFSLAYTLKAGEYSPRWSAVDLNELVEKVIGDTNPDEKERIFLEKYPGEPILETDPLLLERSFRELLENALTHSGKRNPVTVRVKDESGALALEVEDAGEGIPVDFLRRIFTPFSQASEPDKHGKGLGLGLYIVRLATEICGISVEVETEPGKGSLFRLLIPRKAGCPSIKSPSS